MDINSVIDTLCQKFGVAVDQIYSLMPQVVKCHIISDIFWIFILLLIPAIGWFVTYKLHKKWVSFDKRNDLTWDERDTRDRISEFKGYFMVGTIVFTILSIIILPFGIDDLFRWLCMPKMQFINYLTNMIQS